MTDTDLRTAAAAFEADLSEYCDGPLRDALRAALAQSEHNKKVDDWGATLPPQSDGWQPIETAPKDGTRIIVAKQSGYVMAWASSAYWFERQYKDREKYSGWTDGFDTLATPTHWMPLPAPPGEKP